MMDIGKHVIEFLRGDILISKFSSVVNGTLVIREDELMDIYWYAKPPIIFSLMAFYLTVALRGPKWMANTPPFDLRKYLILYNAFQVFICTLFMYIAYFSYLSPHELLRYVTDNVCRPVEKPYDSPLRILTMHGAAMYLLVKMLDLIDTVFMVARKQFSHITFLHLFHHTTMVLSVWYQIIYVRGELGIVFAAINMIVHIIMYSYYLVTSLGPYYKRIVGPWKKYVTLLQMGQFGFIILVLIVLTLGGCEMSPNFMNMWFINNILFLILFLNYYVQTYLLKNKTQ